MYRPAESHIFLKYTFHQENDTGVQIALKVTPENNSQSISETNSRFDSFITESRYFFSGAGLDVGCNKTCCYNPH